VRLTHSKHPKVICQIIYSTLVGDKILCQANSSELRRFGLEAGLTNYAAGFFLKKIKSKKLKKQ